MVIKKTAFILVFALMALGLTGALLVLEAFAVPAQSLPFLQSQNTVINLSVPNYISEVDANKLASQPDVKFAVVADTKSMEPVLIGGDQVIEKVPKLASDVSIGDIITYDSSVRGLTIIHRVVELGSDEFGWFAKTKGDNSPHVDSEKIRFPQVSGIVVGIVN